MDRAACSRDTSYATLGRVTRRDALLMIGCAAVFAALSIAVGDRIGVNGGQGWDGMGYTDWARDLPRALDTGVTAYQAQRMLPSAIVYAALAASSRTVPHTILAFQIVDAVALVLAALVWTRIAATLAWSRAAAWAGFTGVFASFAIARHALYYPTLTDVTAFALGMAMTWAFVADRPIALAVVALAGVVTWPALPMVALILLLARRCELPELPAQWIRPVAIGIAALGAAGVCGAGLYFHAHPLRGDEKWMQLVPSDLLWLTVPLLAAWTGLGWYLLASRRRSWNAVAYVRGLLDLRLAFAVAWAIAVLVFRWWWVKSFGTRGRGPELVLFEYEFAAESLRGPLWNLVHHVVYFGPIIVVAVGAWRRVAEAADAWGPGAILTLAATIAFAIGSESRQWIELFPFLAAATIAATAAWWTTGRALGFAALCLAWSKLWWPLRYDQPTSPFEWPALRYFMQLGKWASDETFAAHAAAVAVTAAVLVFLHRRRVA
jgi:hypothetical protein